MILKLFRKPTEVRPSFQPDSTLAEALARRVNAIEFQPSRGFLKDQWQQKRSPQMDSEIITHRSNDFGRRVSA